jgi:hypothetical protein
MKRTGFLASVLGALAAVGIPLPKLAKKGPPSLVRFLSPQVIVKWDKWQEWVDFATREPHAAYTIRYTVVPKRFIGVKFDPKRSFFYVREIVDNEYGGYDEKQPVVFHFHTAGAEAVGARDVAQLRREVQSGKAQLDWKHPACAAQGFMAHGWSFVKRTAFQARVLNVNDDATQPRSKLEAAVANWDSLYEAGKVD